MELFAAGWAPPLLWTVVAAAADRLCLRLRGRAPLAADPQALVWLAVLSLFARIGVELLRFDAWTWAGFPSSELLRYACLGWLFAVEAPVWVAVHGLAAGFPQRRDASSRTAAWAAVSGATCLGGALALSDEGWSASLTLTGLWLLLEVWNARSGLSGVLSGGTAGWALTAALLVAAGEALQPALGPRRFYNVGFEDPHLFDAPLRLLPALAAAPLTMLASYRRATSLLDLPRAPESKDSIKTADEA